MIESILAHCPVVVAQFVEWLLPTQEIHSSNPVIRNVFFYKNWPMPGHFFFIFVFSTINSKYVHYKILLMTGLEPRTSEIGSERSANWATTAVHEILQMLFSFKAWAELSRFLFDFVLYSQHNDKYCTKLDYKKRRWCAWDSNLGPQSKPSKNCPMLLKFCQSDPNFCKFGHTGDNRQMVRKTVIPN